MTIKLSAPCPINPTHDLNDFCSGEPMLDMWLRAKALKNEDAGASRTYVLTKEYKVVAYYSLAVGSVAHAFTPSNITRNMPNPLPIMILARLAVAAQAQGQGIGKALVRDALLRTTQAAQIAGIRALLVHALHAKAAGFYRQCGFQPSPVDDLTLMARLF